MATIKQIAQKAGVSPTTVSNVLHGNTAKVSPATLEKVQAILKEENYAPNMGAIILAHSNSRIVGVIMFMAARNDETVLEDPFTSTILGVIEEEIRSNGYFMMIHTTADIDEVLRLAATWKLDGLILLWVPGEICSTIRKSIDTPVVFIDCYFDDDGQAYHNIGLEDKQGGYEMTRYLLAMGHTRIAFLSSVQDFPGSDHARYGGFKQAFREKGMPLPEDCFIALSRDRRTRYDLYRRLGTDPFPFTALFFSADYYAADAITFFQDHGIEVPGQISVAGFDDTIFSRLVRPRLTTVHQDVAQKGRCAVSMLIRLMKDEPVLEANVRLPVRMVIRDSVRKREGT
jgi:LacI family transcriptional regulator